MKLLFSRWLKVADRRWRHFYTGGTFLLQVLFVFLLYSDPKPCPLNCTENQLLVLAFPQMLQVLLMIFIFAILFSQLRFKSWTTTEVWSLYLVTLFAFAGFYFFFALASENSDFYDLGSNSNSSNYTNPAFKFPVDWCERTKPLGMLSRREPCTAAIYLHFLFFSCATQTLVGFGDVTPTIWYTEILANIHMLVGLLFSVMIVGMTLDSLRRAKCAGTPSMSQYSTFNNTMISRDLPGRGLGTRLLGRRIAGNSMVRKLRRFCRDYLLLLMMTVQGLHFLIIYKVEPFLFQVEAAPHRSLVLALISALIQVGLAFIVIMTSLKYVRHSENITLKFLIQSFLSVCLHFAGVYILVFLFEREKSWNVEKIRSFRDGWKRGDDESVFWGVVLDFIYYSITTMTTAGYGDMSPRSPTAISMVIIQMLASAIFVQVILALGVSMVSTATLDVPSEFEQQFIDDGYSSVDPSDTPWGWKESQRSDRESSARPTNSMKSDSAASISTFSFPSSVHTNTPGTAVNETNSLLRKGGVS